MSEIRVLPQAVADKIAAGEVAERPSAVVKELVENSIDAGATQITVEIKNGGISYILVEDNGCGIPFDEVEFAFVRHATSKLREIDDLFQIQTMGFRGEALASICAVADVEVITKEPAADIGARVIVKHGEIQKKEKIACNSGTIMTIENLFSSVPARMKFLKKNSTEAGYVEDVLSRIALSKPRISFKYICDGKEIFSTSGDGELKNAILNIYGIEHAKGVLAVDYEEHGVSVKGVVGKAELSRGNRTRQTLFVNGRYIKNHVVSKIVEEAYRNVIMTGKFPFFVLDIMLASQLVDVNVHPAKTEIKFANEKEIYDIVYRAVKNAIYKRNEEVPTHQNPVVQNPQMRVDYGTAQNFDRKGTEELDKKTISEFIENTTPQRGAMVFREPSGKEGFESIKAESIFLDGIKNSIPQTEKGSGLEKTAADFFERLPQKEDVGSIDNLVTATKTAAIGQVFDTYVIAEKADRMFMIDQHAAHERKRFEMLKEDYEKRGVSGQILLVPVVMDVDKSEIDVVKERREILCNMGFDIDEFGKNSVIIRQTPLICDDADIKNLALEVIDILKEDRPLGLLSFEERILDTISCKYAIKANKRLSSLEMEKLVEDVERLEKKGITTCPHGRPIKIEFSKREIEKMFKRIV